MMHELIAPHRVERFTEHWFPVNRLGGAWNEATVDAALRLAIEGNKASIAVNANGRFADAELAVDSGAVRVRTERVTLDPAAPLTSVVDLPAGSEGRPVTVTLTARDGRRLLRYSSDTLPDANPEFRPKERPVAEAPVATSPDQPYQAGLTAEAEGRYPESRPLFEEALRRDPNFAPAHVMLGLAFYRSGEYDRAAEHLEQALKRDRFAYDAHYYLGLARRAQGRPVEAAGHFAMAARAGQFEGVSHYVLGEIALAAGRTGEAVDELARAVAIDGRDLQARTVLALAERLDGRLEAARAHIDAVVAEAPTSYLALAEQRAVYKALGRAADANRAGSELWRLLAREPDSVLELAFDYADAGRLGEAAVVLEEAVTRAGSRPVYPMIHYTLGYLYGRAHDRARASTEYALGAAGDPALVFPHRVEEIEVLAAARATNPNDARAAYYLGNALASRLRGEEALAAWRDAVRLEPANLVARRNLARALAAVAGRNDEAAAEYERAVAAAPDDFRLYVELAALFERMGALDRRVRLLDTAPEAVKRHSPVALALAGAYVDAGRFADAAAVFDTHQFTSGEGDQAMLTNYRRAHIGLARAASAAGDHVRAAAEYVRATDYPKTLGIGRPGMESLARDFVAAARELEAAGRAKEADALWQRAATDPLNSPTEPGEPWSEHYYFKAVALEHTGRRDEARALYERLARLADDRAMLEAEPAPPAGAIRWALAGAGLRALGREAEARAALERARARDPKSELARAQLAEIDGGGRPGGR
jgi:tetratricopeptide (TPR) repeat protein